MKASVAPLMMRIVTARGGDKPNHWVTIKFKRSIKLKWPVIDKLYRKAVIDDIFQELNKQVPNITMQLIDRAFKQMLYDALYTNNREDWLVKIKAFRNYNSEADLTAKRDLMSSIFNIFSNLYDGASQTLSSSESCLRYYVIDPLLQACNKYLKDQNNDVTFYPGEIELKAMTVQLKDQGITDKRLRYNADGTILFNRIPIEILLSEVSSAFAENNKARTSFDHYKAMFGLLMMLKTIVRRYKYASFNTFKGLKVHFIHAHKNKIDKLITYLLDFPKAYRTILHFLARFISSKWKTNKH